MKTTTQKLIVLLFLIAPILSFGQNRNISGTVVSFNKFPLKDITITAKNAKTEAITDANGQFEIEVKKKDVIRVQETVFVEYSKKISHSENSLKINLIIKNDEKNMEDAVISGYISKKNLDYGMRNLWHLNSEFSHFNDTYDAIKYTLPEASIFTENGQRGVQFRGARTLSGSNFALILLDGVITDNANSIVPASIISITRLTSAQAAIYGSRASNGIISIETK